MNLEGRSALVTGGAGGLGGATVAHLSALGVGVVIFVIDADRAKALSERLGARAIALRGDHNNDSDVRAAIDAAKSLGVFSINVNAAGAVLPTPPTATPDGVPHDMDVFKEMIAGHL